MSYAEGQKRNILAGLDLMQKQKFVNLSDLDSAIKALDVSIPEDFNDEDKDVIKEVLKAHKPVTVLAHFNGVPNSFVKGASMVAKHSRALVSFIADDDGLILINQELTKACKTMFDLVKKQNENLTMFGVDMVELYESYF